jgi:hypothetical protein
MRKTTTNKAGAGNGAEALSFHVGRLGRAVPDLFRSASERHHAKERPYRW